MRLKNEKVSLTFRHNFDTQGSSRCTGIYILGNTTLQDLYQQLLSSPSGRNLGETVISIFPSDCIGQAEHQMVQ